MASGSESVIMVLHLKGDRVENLSSIGVSENGADLDRKVAEAVQASIASGARRTEKLQVVRNLLAIAVSILLISLVPVAIAVTLLIWEVTAVAGSLRQTSAILSVNRESVMNGIDTLARHAEQLSPERDQQLLRDLNIIVRHLQPYADTVRPLFTGTTK